MYRYSGVVVLFNPANDVVNNINSYINNLDKLYVIDNSELVNTSLVNNLKRNNKIKYISLCENKGLAYALNLGCKMSIEDGYDYVLTMDQDSCFKNEAVENIINFIENSNTHYAIVASNAISTYYDETENKMKQAYTEITSNKECNWVMTSGSMMCLKDFNNTKGFDEQMFIAHIDIDICIQFHNNGEKIIKLESAKLFQQFGNSKPKKILWKTVHPSYASSVRTYYLFRNQKYLEKKYGKDIKGYIGVSLWKFIVKITLFEDEKIQKYKLMIRGLKDAKRGLMGAYQA